MLTFPFDFLHRSSNNNSCTWLNKKNSSISREKRLTALPKTPEFSIHTKHDYCFTIHGPKFFSAEFYIYFALCAFNLFKNYIFGSCVLLSHTLHKNVIFFPCIIIQMGDGWCMYNNIHNKQCLLNTPFAIYTPCQFSILCIVTLRIFIFYFSLLCLLSFWHPSTIDVLGYFYTKEDIKTANIFPPHPTSHWKCDAIREIETGEQQTKSIYSAKRRT